MPERACEQEWSQEKARGVRELIERLSGKACPCDRGLVCPLLPDVQRRLRLDGAKVTLRSGAGVLVTLMTLDALRAVLPT